MAAFLVGASFGADRGWGAAECRMDGRMVGAVRCFHSRLFLVILVILGGGSVERVALRVIVHAFWSAGKG